VGGEEQGCPMGGLAKIQETLLFGPKYGGPFMQEFWFQLLFWILLVCKKDMKVSGP